MISDEDAIADLRFRMSITAQMLLAAATVRNDADYKSLGKALDELWVKYNKKCREIEELP